MSARIAKAAALSPFSFRKRYRSSYETPSLSSSLTLLVLKRYGGTSELILDTKENEGRRILRRMRRMGVQMRMTRERESLDDEGQVLDDEGQGLYDEGQGLDNEGQGLEDEEPSIEEEEVAPEGSSGYELHLDAWVDPRDSWVYTVKLQSAPPAAPVQTLLSPEWSLGSLPVSPLSLVVPSPIASPVATTSATISVDEDQFLEVGAQLELYEGILHDHT
ncbi:hypothetical protein Tco_0247403 [Tanacetum coccineum]